MPALPSFLIEPFWRQFSALLPPEPAHPLIGHRPRIPDRIVFDKLVQVLVFGAAYWQIADQTCSATTLRRRRDEWRGARPHGSDDDAVSGGLRPHDRLAARGRGRGRLYHQGPLWRDAGRPQPGRPRQVGNQTLHHWMRRASLWVWSQHPPIAMIPRCWHQPWTLWAISRSPQEKPPCTSTADTTPPRPALNSSAAGWWVALQKEEAGAASSLLPLGGGTNQLLAQRVQEARLVHRAERPGHQLLPRLRQRGHHPPPPDPGGVEALSLGWPSEALPLNASTPIGAPSQLISQR
jgi:hypothetical protein